MCLVGHTYFVLKMKKDGESIYFFEDQEEKLTTFKAVKKVPEVNNHKKEAIPPGVIILTYRLSYYLGRRDR